MIYVLSDIHGRDDRFNSILKQIHLRSSDHLYILGDVIDRNDGGIRLLRRISRAKNMTMLHSLGAQIAVDRLFQFRDFLQTIFRSIYAGKEFIIFPLCRIDHFSQLLKGQ